MSKTVKILDEFKINYLTQAQYDAEVAGGTVQPDELYLTLDNSASATQTLTNKTISYADNTLTGVQPTITGGASSITSSNLTASKVLVSDASGKVSASAVPPSLIKNSGNIGATINTTYFSGGFCTYRVSGGTCHVAILQMKAIAGANADRVMATNLPKCGLYTSFPVWNATFQHIGYAWIEQNNTYMNAHINNANELFWCSFTYPVADDWA